MFGRRVVDPADTLPVLGRTFQTMRRIAFIPTLASASLLLVLATGCLTPTKTVQIGPGESGSTVRLAPGDLLRIELQSDTPNVASWETLELNSWVIARVDRPEFLRPRNAEGGTLVLDYRAVGTGTSKIRLGEIQPWQGHGSPAQTVEYTVVVEKQGCPYLNP